MPGDEDLTIDNLLLEGGPLRADVAEAITAATITRTIDSSPTLVLTVQDKDRKLLREGYFGQRLTCQVNDHSFEIAQLSKTGDSLKITMEDLIVTAVSTGGSGGEDRLTENVTLNFAKVKFEYDPQTKKGAGTGAKTAAWDIAANKAYG